MQDGVYRSEQFNLSRRLQKFAAEGATSTRENSVNAQALIDNSAKKKAGNRDSVVRKFVGWVEIYFGNSAEKSW